MLIDEHLLGLRFNQSKRIIPINVIINILDLTYPTDLDLLSHLNGYY